MVNEKIVVGRRDIGGIDRRNFWERMPMGAVEVSEGIKDGFAVGGWVHE